MSAAEGYLDSRGATLFTPNPQGTRAQIAGQVTGFVLGTIVHKVVDQKPRAEK
jgi:hypothetical protein